MPLYEYRCHQCGNTFEVMQKFSDTPLTVHEGCGGEVEKLISLSAFQLKGTGWYATDYAKGGKSSATNGTNGKSDSKSDSKAETSKSDGKSETSKSETAKSESGKSDTGKTESAKPPSSSKAESKPKSA